ncbi:hypothetical protein FHG64_18005 [Antarcticibacterium flavum]|uniref:Uncharacterized protein n=1 Tax=Antarcticibacterium flavum TaxID=2058175 RepID=A0A5B7X8S7_9FLAO|nr:MULTISPECIES: hypothetical protein [Antarcticibacterium]MCM4160916.1 hypothetical protein [Antarcticibacterium sp. W02-3]QCY71138.1 hypothetical protein FHG64_18005 [Antarcticibacterium flavum]
MKKNILNLIFILSLIFGCQSKKENENSDSYILKINEDTEYIIFESSALSSDDNEIAFIVGFQMEIVNENNNQNAIEVSDLEYYTKAAVTSNTRSFIGSKPKEELTELRKLNSDLPESVHYEEMTEIIKDINTMLNEIGTRVTSLVITIQ